MIAIYAKSYDCVSVVLCYLSSIQCASSFYIVSCHLSDYTTFLHIISQTARFSNKIKTFSVLIFSTSWSENIQVHSTSCCVNVRRTSWKVCLICEFSLQLEFSTLMLKKSQKPKVLNAQPVSAGSLFRDGQTWRIQYLFISILRSHLKGTYTKLHTQHPYKSIAWDPSSTLHVENYLILLNKLTSKGAIWYLIIMHSKVFSVWSNSTDIYIYIYICRIVSKNMQHLRYNLCTTNVQCNKSTQNFTRQGNLRHYLDYTGFKYGVIF
jgi:hypothetical protein